MSTKKEEKLVEELVKDLYNLFYAETFLQSLDKMKFLLDNPKLKDPFNPVLTPIVFSRIIRFVREFTNDPDFILGE